MKYSSDALKRGIVAKAAEDYREALKHGDTSEARRLERWLLSDWGQALSQDCGEIIIERIKEEVRFQKLG
jgi:hypothetical protein